MNGGRNIGRLLHGARLPAWILTDPMVEGWTVWQAGGSVATTPAWP